MSERVVVAMSGGVDSAAAALLLQEQGYDIIGISMQVWDYRSNGGSARKATCCSPADFNDARSVAERFDFPFYVYDFEEQFQEKVIDPFVQSYLSGRTPNPCLDCNRHVKFHALRKRAALLGAKIIATGHYAQIRPKDNGTLGLYRGGDPAKDQSYFLCTVNEESLAQSLFPVGELEKSEVRRIAGQHGFRTHDKKDRERVLDQLREADVPATIVDRDSRIDLDGQHVHLITAHSAKGLEFPIVIVPWVVEGTYPDQRSLSSCIDQDERDEVYELHKKLLYVALSRAARRLYMITDAERPSPFLKELDANLWATYTH